MNGLAMFTRRKTITFDELQVLQLMTIQVVCSLELAAGISDLEKKRLAFECTASLLDEVNIVAPPCVIETAIDSSIYSIQATGGVGT